MSYESSIGELHEKAMAAVFDQKWDDAIRIINNIKDLEVDLAMKNAFAAAEAAQEARAYASKFDNNMYLIKRKSPKGQMIRHFPVRDMVRKETEKALGVTTGCGNRNLKFIAKSLCIKNGTEWYAPEWVLDQSYWKINEDVHFSEVEM